MEMTLMPSKRITPRHEPEVIAAKGRRNQCIEPPLTYLDQDNQKYLWEFDPEEVPDQQLAYHDHWYFFEFKDGKVTLSSPDPEDPDCFKYTPMPGWEEKLAWMLKRDYPHARWGNGFVKIKSTMAQLHFEDLYPDDLDLEIMADNTGQD
jgi:hypothetical protein